MTTTLLRNAHTLITMNDAREVIPDGALFARDQAIEWLGPTVAIPPVYLEADRVIDATNKVVLPGLVNTHHHLYQSLTRVLAQNDNLFGWLTTLYRVWANLTDEAIYISTLTGLAELALSGCTTSSDHLYIFPNDCTLDSQIRAAGEIGVRFHAARGSMSLGESKGGLPPDRVTEDEKAILVDSRRLIEQYHDDSRHAMMRIVLAPCSPFSVTPDLMRQSAELARAYGVKLHTHLAETYDEEVFCLETFGQRPIAYVESLGWTGDDVWHAHCVHMNPDEISLFGKTGTGVAHCPSSNMRLGSGIAPVLAWHARGVKAGLGVDGSASNDGAHLLGEARQALLLQRVAPAILKDATKEGASGLAGDPGAMTAQQALEMATRGGAAVLGRDDIGYLAPGMSADFIAFDLLTIPYAGATHDPLAALVFCAPQTVDLSVINGRIVVEDGQLRTVDLGPVIERHNRISRELLS